MNDLKKGIGLDILFLDIELLQKNGIEIGTFILDELEDVECRIAEKSDGQFFGCKRIKIGK